MTVYPAFQTISDCQAVEVKVGRHTAAEIISLSPTIHELAWSAKTSLSWSVDLLRIPYSVTLVVLPDVNRVLR